MLMFDGVASVTPLTRTGNVPLDLGDLANRILENCTGFLRRSTHCDHAYHSMECTLSLVSHHMLHICEIPTKHLTLWQLLIASHWQQRASFGQRVEVELVSERLSCEKTRVEGVVDDEGSIVLHGLKKNKRVSLGPEQYSILQIAQPHSIGWVKRHQDKEHRRT